MTTLNQEQLEEKLGQALAEHVQQRLQNEAADAEMQKYLMKDINSLLLTAGPGAEISRKHLLSPTLLQSHLKASMQLPAQVLARELPKRAAAWLAAEPNHRSPERPQWADEGRWLLDQARLNQDESR